MSSKLHPEFIKAKIRRKYGSLRAFERQYGLATTSSIDVLRGRKSSKTISAMAKVVGVTEPALVQALRRKSRHYKSINMDSHRLNEGAK